MRDLFEMDLLFEGTHDFEEFNGIPVIFREIFLQKEKGK
jgi:hypothetical protein